MAPGVFCHYLVGGLNASNAAADVAQAKAMGFDAFALNVISTDSWSNDVIALLFAAAAAISFQLFFSFDMTHFTEPSQFFYLLDEYAYGNYTDTYYQYESKPFVSTFYGGTLTFGDSSVNAGWQDDFIDAYGKPVFFIPAFSDSPVVADPSNMYTTFTVADGLFSWESAWPQIADGKVNVSSTIDQEYQTAAKAANKPYMMPMSTLQFKHLDSSDNWYRIGELNLAQRMPEVLSVQPAFLEYLTWNDGPESHYIANVWDDAIEGSVAHAYIDGFDHTGWQNVITPFISAFKAGKSDVSEVVPLNNAQATGVFWYRTILTTATCASDSLGKPDGWANAQDVINVAILLSSSAAGATVNVYSGGTKIGTETGITGLNSWSFSGLTTGEVKVEVLASGSGSTLLSETGGMQVAADAATCNYNYYVVGL